MTAMDMKHLLVEDGGEYDPVAYGLGFMVGYVKRHLLTEKRLEKQIVPIVLVPQLDLLAMERGLVLTRHEDAGDGVNTTISIAPPETEEELT